MLRILRFNSGFRIKRLLRLIHNGGRLNAYESDPYTSRNRQVGDYSTENRWNSLKNEFSDENKIVPLETDCLIVGGGIMGSAVAYWLKQKNLDMKVTIVERDSSYTRASTVLSCGGIRQQFSLPENIRMSMFGAEFLKNVKQNLSVYDLDPPDVQYFEKGYLFLASEKGAETLMYNHKIQTEVGAKVMFLTKKDLRHRWPWLNIDDIECGTISMEREGWFDPWLFLVAFRQKNKSMGVQYVKGDVTGFQFRTEAHNQTEEKKQLTHAHVRLLGNDSNDMQPIKFRHIVNAAGPSAGEVSKLVGIGGGDGLLSVALPVEPRKRYVYVIHAPKIPPNSNLPFLIDPTGVYMRRESGDNFICGKSPTEEQEPPTDNLEVDYDFFQDEIWPVMAHRIPAMETLKLRSAWSGYYEVNTADENLIIGSHPYYENFYFVNGSSGHGLQHAPAAGRAISELIVDGCYKTIDLSRMSFNRLVNKEYIFENNIV
ncbi:FAD-dependent oxidoreductase domain-containing protein 1-like [Tubulanus polymorphus]|uniref:FAD-dependent oxidoreductase domain-containing protein 1-like n=1 Tax=Tubulanus polymorphus TaxID=672921 RepID=UPI003DA29051